MFKCLILLFSLILCACHADLKATDTSESSYYPHSKLEVQKYEQVYEKTLHAAQRGDCEAQFALAYLPAPNLFLTNIVNKSENERFQIALTQSAHWVRKAAYSGCKDAIHDLASSYASGVEPFTKDVDLGKCFFMAEEYTGHLPQCLRMEVHNWHRLY